MHSFVILPILFSLFNDQAFAQNSPPAISYKPNKTRANEVKKAFRHAWDSYITYAEWKDELRPVSCAGRNNM
jgi:hypothetical protein